MRWITGGLRAALFVFRLSLAVLVAGAALSVGGYARNALPQQHVITYDYGGRLDLFAIRYTLERRRGDTFVVDGACYSACTMILGMIPRDRVCVTPYAVFGFHAAFTVDENDNREFSAEGTEEMWLNYPRSVRELLRAHGWPGPNVDQPTLIYLTAADLWPLYRYCR
jgi:hypothetical protein